MCVRTVQIANKQKLPGKSQHTDSEGPQWSRGSMDYVVGRLLLPRMSLLPTWAGRTVIDHHSLPKEYRRQPRAASLYFHHNTTDSRDMAAGDRSAEGLNFKMHLMTTFSNVPCIVGTSA